MREAFRQRDVNLKGILLFGGGLVLVTGVVLFALAVMTTMFQRQAEFARPPSLPVAERDVKPPDPRLEPDPQASLREFLRRQESVLKSYGVADPERGVYRVPIERAMDLLLKEGLPARERK